jgi:hypothetical protein
VEVQKVGQRRSPTRLAGEGRKDEEDEEEDEER